MFYLFQRYGCLCFTCCRNMTSNFLPVAEIWLAMFYLFQKYDQQFFTSCKNMTGYVLPDTHGAHLSRVEYKSGPGYDGPRKGWYVHCICWHEFLDLQMPLVCLSRASHFAGGQEKQAQTCLPDKMSFSTLGGGKISMLTHTYIHIQTPKEG